MEMECYENYEKPALKFVSLRNENAVANTCWGYHGTSQVLFCDIPGEGYCSFQIGSGSCNLNLINVMYYDNSGNISAATAEQIAALTAEVNKGGNNGQPYKGMGSIVIPDAPNPSWS